MPKVSKEKEVPRRGGQQNCSNRKHLKSRTGSSKVATRKGTTEKVGLGAGNRLCVEKRIRLEEYT